MLFALICTDKPNHLETRLAARPDHLEFLKGLGDRVVLGGPFLGDDGKPNGSLIILKGESLAEVKDLAARDPYVAAGLFQSVDIRPWDWRIKNPEAK